jgi:peptidoglycan/xylan/chitin deacetylase (PgdA/CDA1 family)
MPNASPWPKNRRCALSLSFDDARPSQLDVGLPILDRMGVKATFYVVPGRFLPRVDEWRAAVARGHEIGNHTTTHPCSGKAEWSRANAVEDYTLERIAKEIDDATETIKSSLGVTPATFAYPCGERHVGRDAGRTSYEPLVNERFLYARGDAVLNSPVDIRVRSSDRAELGALLEHLEEARRSGGWLITVGHEVGMPENTDRLTSLQTVLEAFCRQVVAEMPDVWVATVADAARQVHARRP